MIDKPLYQNPLGGGQLRDIPAGGGLEPKRRLNNPSSKPDFALPLTLEQADPNNLISGFRPPTTGGGIVSDTRDRTLQDPYSIGGAGQLGLARNDGSYTGAMFLPDENRPRSEEDIRNRYEQARAESARQRAAGFLGQVVLPGEQSFDQFKEFTGNTFFLKRNPNIPETAYSNYDLTDVGGFDNPIIDDASMKGLPETNQPPMFTDTSDLPPPKQPPVSNMLPPSNTFIDDMRDKTLPGLHFPEGTGPLQTVQGPEDTLNPYNRVGKQLTGPDQFGDLNSRLNKIEQGIMSLLGNRGQNSSMNFNSPYNFNWGLSSFPPYGGMYG